MRTSPSIFAAVLVGALAGLALGPLASSAHALECGSRIVVRGDREHQVVAVCGEPQSVMTRTETRTVYGAARTPSGHVGSAYTVTVQIDVWIYDFGPSRFMEELTFENGVLVSLRPIGRGTSAGRGR